MSDHSVFTGLGQRGVESSPPADEEEPLSEFERGTQRTMPAAGAASVVPDGAVRSAFDHPYRPAAGSAAEPDDDSAATPPREEKKSMSEKTTEARQRKPRPSKGASPRFQICALLMAKGDLTREELLADVSCDDRQFSNAIFNAKSAEHIVFIAKTDKWHITASGKEWTSGGANLDNHKAASHSPAEVKRGRRQPREKSGSLSKSEKQRLGVVKVAAAKKRKKPKTRRAAVRVQQPTAPTRSVSAQLALSEPTGIQVVQERSFRCAIGSDGGFFLNKGGSQIDLSAQEHLEMLNYLDRVRGIEAPPKPAHS